MFDIAPFKLVAPLFVRWLSYFKGVDTILPNFGPLLATFDALAQSGDYAAQGCLSVHISSTVVFPISCADVLLHRLQEENDGPFLCSRSVCAARRMPALQCLKQEIPV